MKNNNPKNNKKMTVDVDTQLKTNSTRETINLEKDIFPIRPRETKSLGSWLIGTAFLYWVLSLFSRRVLHYLGIMHMNTGKGGSPDFTSVPMLLLLCLVAYIWRYTLPKHIYTYPRDKRGEVILSRVGHIWATLASIALFGLFFLLSLA